MPVIIKLVNLNNTWEIDISLKFFKFTFAGVLFSLITFFSIPMKSVNYKLDSSVNNVNSPAVKNHAIYILRIHFSNPTLSFIQDPTSINTQKLDISWNADLTLKYEETLSIICSVNNFQIFRSLIDNLKEKTLTYILQPLNLNIEIVQVLKLLFYIFI